MALVTVYSAKIQDIDGKPGTVVMYLPTGLTVAEVQAWSDAFLGALDDVTAGKIIGASVALNLTLPAGLKTDAMGGQYINLGGNFGFSVNNSVYRHTVRVPALRESLKSGDEVNIADTAVTTWAGTVTTGVTPALPTDDDGGDLVQLLSGEATFRKA